MNEVRTQGNIHNHNLGSVIRFSFLSVLISLTRFTIIYLPRHLTRGLSNIVWIRRFSRQHDWSIHKRPLCWSLDSIHMDRIRYHLQPVHLKTGSHSPKCFCGKTKKSLLILWRIYSLTLFVGTNYILWPFTVLILLKAGLAEAIVLPTFGLDLAIETIVCPVPIESLSPRLRINGLYGSYWE